jgi:hypothetical protein
MPATLKKLRDGSSYMSMHTVVELPAYLAEAEAIGMTEAERERAIAVVSITPEAGDLIVGTGGCRKVRIAGRGKGKSGGFRVITYFARGDLPVFLLTVFGKGEKADLTGAERNGLAALTKVLASGYRQRVVRLGDGR